MNSQLAVFLVMTTTLALAEKKTKENAFDIILEGHQGKGGQTPQGGNYSVFVPEREHDGSSYSSPHICLKASFTMTFDIEYFAREPLDNQDYIELKKGSMPPIVEHVNGRCMNETDTPYIYLQWDHSYYTVNMTFHTHRQDTGNMWDLHVIELIYDMNNTREFPYVAHASDRKRKVARFVGHLFETPVGMSYECTGPIRITLTNEDDVYEAYLYMRHLHFQPTQIFDNQFSISKQCEADLVPQGPVYDPHMHVVMAAVLTVSVMLMCGAYSFYRRYRVKLLPIPHIILSSVKNGDLSMSTQLFQSDTTTAQQPSYD